MTFKKYIKKTSCYYLNGAIWMHSWPFYQLYTCTQQAMTCPFEYILNLTDEGAPSKNWLISKKWRDNLASRTAPQVLDEQYAYYYLLILALHSTSNILFFKLKKRDIECTIGWKQIRQWNIPVKRKFNRFSHQEKEETTGGMRLQQLKQDIHLQVKMSNGQLMAVAASMHVL